MLLPDQEELLVKLVEAARSVPRTQQQFVLYSLQTMGDLRGEEFIVGDSIDGQLPVLSEDVEELDRAGFLRMGPRQWGGNDAVTFTISPEGFAHYENLRARSPDPDVAIQEEVNRYLDGTFRERFPDAHERLRAAERMLWTAKPSDDFTTIGHKLREALQQFATAMIGRHNVTDADADPAKTKNRLRALAESQRSRLGDAKAELLAALSDYLDAVNNVLQRQEHGDQKVGDPLTWEDARAAVFNTAMLMHEYERLLS